MPVAEVEQTPALPGLPVTEIPHGLALPGMSAPDIGADEVAAVTSVLNSGRLSIGPNLDALEAELAEYLDVPHVACVNSGTSALHLGIVAADVAQGDLVVTSPFSFVASANCILYEGGIPIFVDVDPDTGNIDAESACEVVSDIMHERPAARSALPPTVRHLSSVAIRRGLKALLPVHVFGVPADLDPILGVASENDLFVLEDACEAIGAEYKGRRVGTLGDAGVFGFYPNKQLTTGEGGAICTRSERWHSLFLSLRNQGRDQFNGWLEHDRLGYNYRLDEMSAALGWVQLRRVEELLSRRATVARWYEAQVAKIPGITLYKVPSYASQRSWFVYVVRISPHIDRSALIAKLGARQIPARAYFPPIHLQKLYRSRFGFEPGSFPVAEMLGRQTLALPFSGIMSKAQVDYVCTELRSAVESLS
jgi:dTDP-4-amino-4,6-dideoxygalactose transaminase